jgi:hypothetical protein
MNLAILWTEESRNAKTGPIPVSTTAKPSCPATCPFKGNGCYAEGGPLGYLWSAMSAAGPNATFKNGRGTVRSVDWQTLCDNVAALPADRLWRHNQAGDLPHTDGKIDAAALASLVQANSGKRGFTYTHHDPVANSEAIRAANDAGFTINVSANNLDHADTLAALNLPLVVVLPADTSAKTLQTPQGRKVSVCPATYRDDVTCASCGLCAVRDRKTIVGFPAHGASKARASRVATV